MSQTIFSSSNAEQPLKGSRAERTQEPPDGGVMAYLVVFSAFCCNGILLGIIKSYGVIFSSLQGELKKGGDEAASSKACE